MGVVEGYLQLGLRLGRHVDGLVDAYYGPPELAAEVEAEELREHGALVAEADGLLVALGADGTLAPERRLWLEDQVTGLRVYAGVLAGEQISYLDEIEGCYGVRPIHVAENEFEAARAQLDELLPPGGTLTERHEAWREASIVPPDRIVETMTPVLALLRERTRSLVQLPEDEEFVLEIVSDEPWAAFNYYLGAHRSRIVVNTDLPQSAADLVHLAAHEGYPGHHTEHVAKEWLLVDRAGHLEESIQLVPTPQALLSEGIAELGPELLVDDELEREFARIFEEVGVAYDPAQVAAVGRAKEPLAFVARNAALAIHEDGLPVAEAQAYVERWALATPKRAGLMMAFVTDPTWRAYVTTYTEGLRLARAYVAGELPRLRQLLTEPIRVGELRAAADGGTAVSSGP